MREFGFTIPDGMAISDVARAFTAYLQGSIALENEALPDGSGTHGPYRKQDGDDSRWQLDTTNDYFLHVDDEGAWLNCRHPESGNPVLATMIALFELRYCR